MHNLFFPILSNALPESLNASPSLVRMFPLAKETSPIPRDNRASQTSDLSGVLAFSFALSAMATDNANSGLSTTT